MNGHFYWITNRFNYYIHRADVVVMMMKMCLSKQKGIDGRYFRYFGDTIEYREDALEAYSRIEARNANFRW